MTEGATRNSSTRRNARERVSRALQVARAPFQLIAEHAPVGIFLVDGAGRPIYFNPRACELLGRSETQLLRHDWGRALHPDDRPRVVRRWRRAVATTGAFRAEYCLRRPDGSTIWVQGKVAGLRSKHGGWRIFVGSLNDISARKRAEQALEESRNRAMTVLDTCPLAILSTNREGRILGWNKGAERMFGWTEAEALGRICPTVPRADRPAFRRMICQVLDGAALRGRTLLRRRKDGSTVLVAVSAAPVLDRLGTPTGMVAILDDVTEREALQEQLQVLLEDREQLLRDLHDNCIQALFAIGLNLERCGHMVGSDPARARVLISNATANLSLVIRDLRSFLTQHHRQRVVAFNLHREIERATQVAGDAGPRFTLHIDKEAAGALKAEAAFELLHIAREGISNIVRHARARRADVLLRRHKGGVRLVLDDDGAGLGIRGRRGLGLRDIAGRVNGLGGRWRIASRPGRGTRLIVEVPAQ